MYYLTSKSDIELDTYKIFVASNMNNFDSIKMKSIVFECDARIDKPLKVDVSQANIMDFLDQVWQAKAYPNYFHDIKHDYVLDDAANDFYRIERLIYLIEQKYIVKVHNYSMIRNIISLNHKKDNTISIIRTSNSARINRYPIWAKIYFAIVF